MIHFTIVIFLFLSNSNNYINSLCSPEMDSPNEIKHGILQIDNWLGNKYYEYYINITDYNLNEENIFEISATKDIEIVGNIYTLLTEENIEDIKNCIVKPDISKDIYNYQSNSFKIDSLTGDNYFFMPFKKTSINQKYFIILFSPLYEGFSTETVYYSVSNRIPIFTLKQKENNNIIFSDNLESKNETHLYYKFEIDKNINLTENNIFIYVNDESKSIFLTNLFSLISYNSKMFIIQKNINETSQFYIGIKNKDNKYINIEIKLYENDFYYLTGEYRINQKIYIEKINCENKFYIIENYFTPNNDKMEKYLIMNKLYGNYSLIYYNSIKNLNFEEYTLKEKGIEIKNKIENIEGSLNIYILSCTTPTSFTLEFFSNNEIPISIKEGEQYKTYIYEDIYITEYTMNLAIYEDNYKYKFYISILNKYNINTTLDYIINYRGSSKQISLNNLMLNKSEDLYLDDDYNFPRVWIGSDNGAFIYYYFISNKLYYNIIEGETIIDNNSKKNLAFRIKKDFLFDYITFEAEIENIEINLDLNYELKIINIKDIEFNKIMVPLPEINYPIKSNLIKLKFSNPYNKYDSSIDNDYNNNYFYLLISFNNNIDNLFTNPIYVNIKYIYNENIKPLKQIKSEIILPEIEYEIYGDKNYLNKSKCLININKCDLSKNYKLYHYYENNKNIINQNIILNNREIYLTNNLYVNSKIKIKKLNNDENDNNNDTKSFYPANYYNKGDIFLNYFLINEEIYNKIIITNDFSISYKDKLRKNIALYWKEYIIINNKNNIIHIPTNYSIYILPKDSPVNSICQLSLIPSNKSIINSTEITIDIEEGNYKIAIIASVIDNEFPFINVYDILYLNVSKRINIVLIVFLILLGIIIILVILYFVFRKKKIFSFLRGRETMFSSEIEENKLINGINRGSDEMNNNHNKHKKNKKRKEEIKEKLISNKEEIKDDSDDNINDDNDNDNDEDDN